MKNRRRFIILYLGLLLVLGSFVLYGLQVVRSAPPPDSTPQQLDEFARQYGTDQAFIDQYGVFLLMFLPGLTLIGIYGAIGVQSPDNPIGIVPKAIMLLVMLSSVITAMNSLAVASKAIILSPPAFWMFLAVAALGLTIFAFILVLWNGFRWAMWAYGFAAGLMFILKFAGSGPIIPSIIELSAVVVLIYLIRPVWWEMD